MSEFRSRGYFVCKLGEQGTSESEEVVVGICNWIGQNSQSLTGKIWEGS